MTTSLVKPTISTDDKDLLFYCIFPVEKHTNKKNNKQILRNRRTGKPFIASSNDNRSLLSQMVHQFAFVAKEQLSGPIEERVRACFRFHYPLTKAGKLPGRVIDLSNLYQGPEDCLQKSGVLVDDKQIESHSGSCRVYGSNHPALEVALYRHQPMFSTPSPDDTPHQD